VLGTHKVQSRSEGQSFHGPQEIISACTRLQLNLSKSVAIAATGTMFAERKP
jgi:hypothetical protein